MKKKPLFSLLVLLITASCSSSAISPSKSSSTDIPSGSLNATTDEETMQPNTEFDQPAVLPAESAATMPTIVADVEFNQSTANTVAPAGVLQEISFFGGGGGVRCLGNEISPTITFEPLDGELMTLSTMIVCGWQRGEILKGTIQYPDGRTLAEAVNVIVENEVEGPHALLGFRPAINDPAGTYTFILQGNAGTVQAQATFSKPAGPRLFRQDDAHLLLYGFGANESVKLYSYARTGHFSGWQEYRTDPNGQLSIKIPMATDEFETYFWTIGDQSGEAHLLQEDYWGRTIDWVEQKSIQKQSCGQLNPRLSLGGSARVAFTDGSNMRMREYAGLQAEVLYKIPEGTPFTVIDGPQCVGAIIWWKGRTSDNLEGWMAEYQDGIYLLEPIP